MPCWITSSPGGSPGGHRPAPYIPDTGLPASPDAGRLLSAPGGARAVPSYIRMAASRARAERSHSSGSMVSWTHSGLPFMRWLA